MEMQSKKVKTAPAIVEPENEEKAEGDHATEKTAEEKVFLIDHILEHIFSPLDTPDILNCRLVSHRFHRISQRLLEKRICKSFYYRSPQSKIGLDSSKRSIVQLTEFLEKSASAAEATQQLFSFPCTNFTIYGPQLGARVLQKFLNIYGLNIQKLKIIPCKQDIVHENVRMKQLCKLLTVQAPNLESLSTELHPIVKWQQGISRRGSINQESPFRSHNSSLLKTDPEFQDISSRVESLPRKSNLKILEVSGDGLAKTIECLFQVSPKLHRVVISQDVVGQCDLSYGDYRYFLGPVNRIHLLKSLTFTPGLKMEEKCHGSHYICFDIVTMEKISLDDNLRLRELKIDLKAALRACEADFEFENKVVLMLNRILHRSQDSLERICLSSFSFLRGMKMPATMPKVRELNIEGFRYGANSKPFPKEFCLTETFPQLTCVKLSSADFSDWFGIPMLKDYLNLGEDEKGPSDLLGIKKVIVGLSSCTSLRGRIFTPSSGYLCQEMQKLFPNASIELADASVKQ